MAATDIERGLSTAEVEERIAAGKINRNMELKTKSVKELIIENLCTLFNLINVVLAILVLLAGSFKNLTFLFVVFLNTAIGVIQSMRSKKMVDKLTLLTSKKAIAVRDGAEVELDLDQIVLDDIIRLGRGDQIPADAVVVSGEALVNESLLTGESDLIKKQPGSELMSGSFIDSGLLRARVIHVGADNYVAKINNEAKYVKKVNSEIMNALNAIVRFASIIMIPLGLALFFSSVSELWDAAGTPGDSALSWCFSELLAGRVPSSALLSTVGALLGMIPQGLVLLTSSVLAIATVRLARRKVLAQQLYCIETLARVDVLCLDKTGTITKGHLEVVEFFTADGVAIPLDQLAQQTKLKGLIDLAIGKNSQSMYDGSGRVVGGNATDQALMRFLGQETFHKLDEVSSYAVTKSQSFNSANKFSQAYIAGAGRTFYKGAPEKFLAVAQKYLSLDGDEHPLDLESLNAKIDELAGKSMRVLAFGYSPSEMTENAINADTVLIGLVGIRDDVRPEAREAIAEVQKAGIQVVMITGDRLETAVAIAREAGLLRTRDDVALTSTQLNELSDDEVKKIIPRIRVIARALPTDKSRMVRLCQELNLVVGMTGDGVNDSPALKRADVGFAMGSGTEAAKEAGKIVILDDNFKSIKDAIWYGRTIYHNILKFCRFQLVINVAAVVVSAIAPFFGVEEPLKVTHLLFVNLVMDGLGAIMLGNEPAQERYMSEPPRRRDESIVSKSMMAQIVTMGLWLTALSFVFLKVPFFDSFFASTEQKLSAYFVLFIWSALFNAFNVRSDSFDIFKDLKLNPGFMRVFVIIVLVQAFIVNAALIPVPVFGWISNMFSCVPFPPAGWAAAILLAFTMIPVDILRKVIVGRK